MAKPWDKIRCIISCYTKYIHWRWLKLRILSYVIFLAYHSLSLTNLVVRDGTIPVYHGDNYVLPFRPELIDWNKCAIILPEKDAGNVTMNYIEHKLLPDPERMCRMRNYCYFEIYKKYIETDIRIIDGLVKGLDLVAKGHVSTFRGHQCNHTKDTGCNNI